jgi:hypothetical protein
MWSDLYIYSPQEIRLAISVLNDLGQILDDKNVIFSPVRDWAYAC